jgi:hypothetical protein
MLNDINNLNLPSVYLADIFNIMEPYMDFFEVEFPDKCEAINNILNEKVKLKALLDVDSETQQNLINYDCEYKAYLSLVFFLPKEQSIQGSYLRIHNFFTKYDEIYKSLSEELVKSIRKLKVKIGIDEKYIIKKNTNLNSNKKFPLDIKSEFQKLFVDPITARKFIAILIDAEYLTDDEKWKGVSTRPGELREAFRVLKSLNLLTPGRNSLNSLKIFYKRFGLKPEEPGDRVYFISIKSLSSQTTTKDNELFIELLSQLSICKN